MCSGNAILMTAPHKLVALWLTLLSPAWSLASHSVNAEAGLQSPQAGRAPLQRPPSKITVDVTSPPIYIKTQIIFTASVNPPVGQLQYRFYLDGQLLSADWQESPQYAYVPQAIGSHVVHAEARPPSPGGARGRTALAAIRPLRLETSRTPFEVLPAPIPQPPPVQQPPPRITIDVSPRPIYVATQAAFTASVNPPVERPLQYRFYLDGQLLSADWQESPQYTYVPQAAGSHVVQAEARPRSQDSAAPPLTFDSSRTSFEVLPRQLAPPKAPTLPPAALTLRLTSPKVVAGEPAMFAVSVDGGGALPLYILDLGDTAPQTRREGAFTHVYQNAGTYIASVRLPAGIAGSGSTVTVTVVPKTPWGLLAVGALVVAGVYVIRKVRRPPLHPGVLSFHAEPNVEPRFHPAKPPGVSVELHLVQNVTSTQFTPRVRIDRRA